MVDTLFIDSRDMNQIRACTGDQVPVVGVRYLCLRFLVYIIQVMLPKLILAFFCRFPRIYFKWPWNMLLLTIPDNRLYHYACLRVSRFFTDFFFSQNSWNWGIINRLTGSRLDWVGQHGNREEDQEYAKISANVPPFPVTDRLLPEERQLFDFLFFIQYIWIILDLSSVGIIGWLII